MKKNRILTIVLSVLLMISAILVTTVSAIEAQPSVAAKIGDASYASLADALDATKTMTGDVTVEIYDKVTLNMSLSGSYDSITFVGKTENAEIYLDVQGYITATGKTVNFEKLNLSKVAGGFIDNAGFMNVAFGVYDVAEVNYTDCIFLNGACASYGDVTFEGCTFYHSHDRYGLWAYGDVNTTVNNCKFDDFRGIKLFSEGLLTVGELTVTNTDFSAVDDKPAIVLTSGKSVALSGNTYSATGTFELDLDGVPNGTTITTTDEITCVNDNGACGVIVDGKIYTTVAQAAEAATAGSSVTLLHNTAEDVEFAAGVKFNANGYKAENVGADFAADARIGYTYYETLKEAFGALKSGDTLILLRDVKFEGNWDCRSYAGNQYMHSTFTVPVTIDGNGHTLKLTGTIDDKNNMAVFKFEAPATVKNLTLDTSSVTTNRYSGIVARADIAVEDCTFIGSTTATSARAIIIGEGLTVAGSVNATITNCNFTNWKNGVVDDMNGKDSAKSVTVTGCTFNNASANLSATESVTFSGNAMNDGWLRVTSYTNQDGYTVTAMGNTLTENGSGNNFNAIDANPANITTDDASLKPVAKYNGSFFMSMDDLVEYITSGDTIVLAADLDLFGGTLTIPASVAKFNGNGKVINGSIAATGDLEFIGHTTATNFNAGYNKPTITIGAGACLELNGTGRMVIGHGATFNITGSIADAKTADKATIQPSFIVAAGGSFTGYGLTFNVTDAYVKFNAGTTSKNISANGTFDFNVENSIWEQTGSLGFYVPTQGMDPTFNLNLKDSVLTSTSHLVFAVSKGDIVVDNSNVNVNNRQQLEVRGNMIVKNGAEVWATNRTSSNANMPGTLTVDNATYDSIEEYTGSGLGIGTLIVKNGAKVTLGAISNANVYVYTNPANTFSYTALKANAAIYYMDDYAFTLDLDKTALKATESLTVTVSVDKAYYSAEYTFTYDATKFSCAADEDADGVIFVTNLYKGEAGVLATYTLVALNDIESVSAGNTLAVDGNVLQYKEQILNDMENNVEGDSEGIKVSLNYTAETFVDYVPGYSLVLVRGEDAGYAYNGVKMFYVEYYGAYAVLVEGEVTAEMIDVALSKATGCETITQSYDVNAEYVADGKIDLKDATAVYACSVLDFAVADYMELYLRADVNGDGVVNMIDINAVTVNYTK